MASHSNAIDRDASIWSGSALYAYVPEKGRQAYMG